MKSFLQEFDIAFEEPSEFDVQKEVGILEADKKTVKLRSKPTNHEMVAFYVT